MAGRKYIAITGKRKGTLKCTILILVLYFVYDVNLCDWLTYISNCIVLFFKNAILKNSIRAIPQKRLPQGEKMKVTYPYKVCFPLKINEEGLRFDDEVKKVGNYMTSISFSAIKRDNILQEL